MDGVKGEKGRQGTQHVLGEKQGDTWAGSLNIMFNILRSCEGFQIWLLGRCRGSRGGGLSRVERGPLQPAFQSFLPYFSPFHKQTNKLQSKPNVSITVLCSCTRVSFVLAVFTSTCPWDQLKEALDVPKDMTSGCFFSTFQCNMYWQNSWMWNFSPNTQPLEGKNHPRE